MFLDSDIEYIKKQYFSCTPINKFTFTESHEASNEPIDYDAQIKIFENTIEDPISMKYPSRLSYRTAFLRALIEKLEKSNEEVYDKLYETLASYMIDDKNENTDTCHYRQFLTKNLLDTDRIILRESKSFISEGTTGLCTWQAGFALAEWCNANKAKISDKRVLELGSGVGLTGISVILMRSPTSYTFTDCHSGVLDAIVKNVRLNLERNADANFSNDASRINWDKESYKMFYRNIDVRVKRLPWSSITEDDIDPSSTNFDVVLASDVIYDESIFDEFIQALRVLAKISNPLVIVATTVRNNETLDAFLRKLDIYGLSHKEETVPRSSLFLRFDETPIKILQIIKKE